MKVLAECKTMDGFEVKIVDAEKLDGNWCKYSVFLDGKLVKRWPTERDAVSCLYGIISVR